MSDATAGAIDTQGGTASHAPTVEPDKGDTLKTFTQDEVNTLIGATRTEERNKAAKKYGDYDDLKAAAEGKKTLEERFAEMERKYTQSEANALRLRVAGEYGINTKRADDDEPSDAELFLTASDEAGLIAQAKRYADRVAAKAEAEADRKKKNPTVPKEGTSTKTGTTTEEDELAFARDFFSGGSS